MFRRFFGGEPETKPWERKRAEEIREDELDEIISMRRETEMTYRVEVGTTHSSYDFESDKPILITDAPDYITLTVDDGVSGTIKFYKRNLTFLQEYLPS